MPQDASRIEALLARVGARAAEPPLSEAKRGDLAAGSAEGSFGLVAECGDTLVGYAHLRPNRVPDGWGMEVVVDDAATHDAATQGPLDVHQALVSAAVGSFAHGRLAAVAGASVHHWTSDARVGDMLQGLGFRPDRGLLRMHRPLPAEGGPDFKDGVHIRPFDPARDVDAWLEVNNRAFAGHAENGDWRRADIEERMAYEWFDADGFRTAWVGDDLAAFCWTKVHPDGTGEIYVIAVNPSYWGGGLGTAIVLEGLRHLAEDAGSSDVILYVDAENAVGIRLYERLGFREVWRSDVFVWHRPHGGSAQLPNA